MTGAHDSPVETVEAQLSPASVDRTTALLPAPELEAPSAFPATHS